MALHTVDGHDVIGVVVGFEIQDQGWKTVRPQSSGSKDSALQAVRCIFTQHDTRRPGSMGKMIGHVVEKSLDPMRILQAAQLA